MVNRRQPEADAVKAHPHAKATLARLLTSDAIRPEHRAAAWYMQISNGKIAKEKFRKFFDTQLKKLYGDETVRAARRQEKQCKSEIFLYAKFI